MMPSDKGGHLRSAWVQLQKGVLERMGEVCHYVYMMVKGAARLFSSKTTLFQTTVVGVGMSACMHACGFFAGLTRCAQLGECT